MGLELPHYSFPSCISGALTARFPLRAIRIPPLAYGLLLDLLFDLFLAPCADLTLTCAARSPADSDVPENCQMQADLFQGIPICMLREVPASTPYWFRHRKNSEAEGRGIGLIEARRNLSELARVSQNTEESPSPRMPAPILKGAINYLRGRPGGKRLNSKPQDPLDRTYHGGYPPQEWAEPQADADPTNTFFDGIRDSFATPSSSPQLFSTDVSQPVTTG